jgi:hypothetical protein
MNLKSIKFGSYVWPHNPRTFEMNLSKDIIRHRYPGINGAELEGLGIQARVLNGSGAFFGKNAYSQYKKLESVYINNKIEKLFHPIWGTVSAMFADLTVTNDSTPNYVEYNFSFIEHKDIQVIKTIVPPKPKPSTAKPKPAARTHKVVKGDTLWDISEKYYKTGTKWRIIANANKAKIKDPHWIYPGQVFVIP